MSAPAPVPASAPTPGSPNSPLAPRPGDIEPGSVAAWLLALRPRTLPVAISPVLVAAALAFQRGAAIDFLHVLLALAAAVLIQLISNMQNDVGYTVRGAERHRNRVGLPRATALRLLTAAQVRTAIALAIGVALVLGLPLVTERGWPVLAMGLASIVAALAYMGGPRPIAYTPLGEPMVFVFFGLVAVVGTDYVLTGGSAPVQTWLVAAALGLLAAAALMVNNARDIEHDRSVGRATLPVLIGRGATQRLFAAALLLPFALLALISWGADSRGAALSLLLPLLLLPQALRLIRDFAQCPPGLPYNGVLFRTFLMELKFASLVAAGAVLARLLG